MKRLCSLICLLMLVAITGNSRLYAQEDSLEKGLDFIPFSEFPYKSRYLSFDGHNSYCINFDSRIPAKIYTDLQCKDFVWVEGNTDLSPDVYLKIALPDKSIVGALSFNGATEYRTDMLFIRDLKGKICDTLECCVMLNDAAIKQYELRKRGEVVVYQMIFDSDKLMPYGIYTAKPVPVTGHIHKATYCITPAKKFVKMKEEDTDSRTFSSALLQEHNLWDETAFGMMYKK